MHLQPMSVAPPAAGFESMAVLPGAARMRVLVVTANPPMYRRGLASVLAADAAFDYLGEASDAADARRQLPLHNADVVLIDAVIAQQTQASGRSVLAELRSLSRARFVLLADAAGAQEQQQALAAGASGVLAKDASAAALVHSLHAAYRAPVPLASVGAGAHTTVRPAAGVGEDLTRRECELLELMARGLSNQDIATRLAISVPTVKFHVTNILAKLRADNRTTAVLTALRRKLVALN